MKQYLNYFMIPLLFFGMVSILFFAVILNDDFPEKFFHKETLYVVGQQDLNSEDATELKENKGEFWMFGSSFVLAVISTVAFVIITKPKKESKTTTEKTFIGYRLVNDTRDILIKK